jgi:hypothetical protein
VKSLTFSCLKVEKRTHIRGGCKKTLKSSLLCGVDISRDSVTRFSILGFVLSIKQYLIGPVSLDKAVSHMASNHRYIWFKNSRIRPLQTITSSISTQIFTLDPSGFIETAVDRFLRSQWVYRTGFCILVETVKTDPAVSLKLQKPIPPSHWDWEILNPISNFSGITKPYVKQLQPVIQGPGEGGIEGRKYRNAAFFLLTVLSCKEGCTQVMEKIPVSDHMVRLR